MLILGLILSGCASFGKRLEPPKINIVNILPKEVKAFESVIQIELRVFNTNDTPLKIKGLECDLDLNGKPFATGVKKVDATIDAFGTDTISMVVYSSVLDTVSRIVGLIQQIQEQNDFLCSCCSKYA